VGLFTAMVAALAIVTLAAAPRHWLTTIQHRSTWLLLTFSASVAWSFLLAPRTEISLHLEKTYFARTFVLPLAIATSLAALGLSRSLDLLVRLREVLIGVGVAGSLLAVLQIGASRGYFAPPATKEFTAQFVGVRAIGFSEAPGTWAAFLLLPIAFLVAGAVRRPTLLRAAALVVLLVGLAFSGLRSAWLAAGVVIVGGTVLAAGQRWRRMVPLALGAFSLVVALQFSNFRAFLGGAGSNQVQQESGEQAQRGPQLGKARLSADESLRFRYHIMRAELELGRQHPVAGVGLGNLGFALAELPSEYLSRDVRLVSGAPVEKHNTYTGLFAELGVPGAGAFIAVIVGEFFLLFRIRRALPPGSRSLELVDGFLGALTATAIVAAATEADRQVFLWWISGVVIGLAVVMPEAATQSLIPRLPRRDYLHVRQKSQRRERI
jgi:hypothetical protein